MKIIVIGKVGCGNCLKIKNKLDNKNIKYKYKLISEYSQKEQDNIINQAIVKNIMTFPIVIKDNQIIDVKDIDFQSL